jgi:hypothetical protein
MNFGWDSIILTPAVSTSNSPGYTPCFILQSINWYPLQPEIEPVQYKNIYETGIKNRGESAQNPQKTI